MRLASLATLLAFCLCFTYSTAQPPGGGNDGPAYPFDCKIHSPNHEAKVSGAFNVQFGYVIQPNTSGTCYVKVYDGNEKAVYSSGFSFSTGANKQQDILTYEVPELPPGWYSVMVFSDVEFGNDHEIAIQVVAPESCDVPGGGNDSPVSVQINFPDDGDVFNKGATVGISSTAFVPANAGGAWFCCEVTLNGVFVYEEWAYVYAPGEKIYWPACGPLTETGTYRIRTWSTAPGSSDDVAEIQVVNP